MKSKKQFNQKLPLNMKANHKLVNKTTNFDNNNLLYQYVSKNGYNEIVNPSLSGNNNYLVINNSYFGQNRNKKNKSNIGIKQNTVNLLDNCQSKWDNIGFKETKHHNRMNENFNLKKSYQDYPSQNDNNWMYAKNLGYFDSNYLSKSYNFMNSSDYYKHNVNNTYDKYNHHDNLYISQNEKLNHVNIPQINESQIYKKNKEPISNNKTNIKLALKKKNILGKKKTEEDDKKFNKKNLLPKFDNSINLDDNYNNNNILYKNYKKIGVVTKEKKGRGRQFDDGGMKKIIKIQSVWKGKKVRELISYYFNLKKFIQLLYSKVNKVKKKTFLNNLRFIHIKKKPKPISLNNGKIKGESKNKINDEDNNKYSNLLRYNNNIKKKLTELKDKCIQVEEKGKNSEKFEIERNEINIPHEVKEKNKSESIKGDNNVNIYVNENVPEVKDNQHFTRNINIINNTRFLIENKPIIENKKNNYSEYKITCFNLALLRNIDNIPNKEINIKSEIPKNEEKNILLSSPQEGGKNNKLLDNLSMEQQSNVNIIQNIIPKFNQKFFSKDNNIHINIAKTENSDNKQKEELNIDKNKIENIPSQLFTQFKNLNIDKKDNFFLEHKKEIIINDNLFHTEMDIKDSINDEIINKLRNENKPKTIDNNIIAEKKDYNKMNEIEKCDTLGINPYEIKRTLNFEKKNSITTENSIQYIKKTKNQIMRVILPIKIKTIINKLVKKKLTPLLFCKLKTLSGISHLSSIEKKIKTANKMYFMWKLKDLWRFGIIRNYYENEMRRKKIKDLFIKYINCRWNKSLVEIAKEVNNNKEKLSK